MATYKEIQGYNVEKLSSDPTAAEAVGQLWYNASEGAFKYATQGTGAWSAGGDLNTGRDWMAGLGTQTAAISVGGEPPVSAGAGIAVEQYNGSSWVTKTSLTTYRYGMGGAGTSTSCIVFGGGPPTTGKTEEFNGSTWTEKTDMQAAKLATSGSSAGSVTAALCFGGSPIPNNTDSETWNGTSWVEGSNVNNGRDAGGGCGTSTAAQYNGGGGTWPSTAVYDYTEQYNGVTWSNVNTLNTARDGLGYESVGGQTSSMVAGGATPSHTDAVEMWNGTSWSTSTVLPAVRSQTGNAGSVNTSAVVFGGSGPGSSNHVETFEWSDPVYTVKTVTLS